MQSSLNQYPMLRRSRYRPYWWSHCPCCQSYAPRTSIAKARNRKRDRSIEGQRIKAIEKRWFAEYESE